MSPVIMLYTIVTKGPVSLTALFNIILKNEDDINSLTLKLKYSTVIKLPCKKYHKEPRPNHCYGQKGLFK